MGVSREGRRRPEVARDLGRDTWDAVVVGAGPAGSMAAHELARAGASVLLVDRQAFPRWKVCGACLSPGTQALVRDAGLGSFLDGSGAVPLHTLRLAGWGTTADVPLGPSVALARAALDAALAVAATRAGATFMAPARARLGACRDDHREVVVESEGDSTAVRTRVVIAADGVGSPLLARASGREHADDSVRSSLVGAGALVEGSGDAYEAGVIHMAVGSGGYVGLVILEDGSLDVAAALDPARLHDRVRPVDMVERLLGSAEFRVPDGLRDAAWRGTPALTRRVPTRGAERLFAVGDAAGYVEPFTGEGIGWALAGARTLVPFALEAARGWRAELVHAWSRAHEETIGSASRLCRTLAWGLRRPVVARAALHLLRRVPAVAAPVVRQAGKAPARASGT